MQINETPRIYVFEDFLTPFECQHLINNVTYGKFKRAKVTNEHKLSHNRTNSSCWITHDFDMITFKIANKISNIVNIPLEHAESFQFIHYKKGEFYSAHYDNNNNNGPRIFTAMCYLNDIEHGGETVFNKLNISIQPKAGKLLIFENNHENSLHEAMAPISTEKFAFNLWFH